MSFSSVVLTNDVSSIVMAMGYTGPILPPVTPTPCSAIFEKRPYLGTFAKLSEVNDSLAPFVTDPLVAADMFQLSGSGTMSEYYLHPVFRTESDVYQASTTWVPTLIKGQSGSLVFAVPKWNDAADLFYNVVVAMLLDDPTTLSLLCFSSGTVIRSLVDPVHCDISSPWAMCPFTWQACNYGTGYCDDKALVPIVQTGDIKEVPANEPPAFPAPNCKGRTFAQIVPISLSTSSRCIIFEDYEKTQKLDAELAFDLEKEKMWYVIIAVIVMCIIGILVFSVLFVFEWKRGKPTKTNTTPVQTKTAPIQTKTAPIQTKTAPVQTKTAPVQTKTAP